jgi:putative ABC transport system permease protein
MLGHYLLTLYRSLSRHRLYAAINVLGLAVGIAVFLVLFLDVRFETSFERWIPNASQIYAIRTSGRGELAGIQEMGRTMGDLLAELQADYPQLVGTRIQDDGGTVRQGDKITGEQIEKVDPTFFQVFDLPLVAGDRTALLTRPDDLILSQSKAKQYFGDASPVGRKLTVAYDGEVHDLRVVGVVKDPPKTTDFTFDMITPLKVPTPAQDPAWREWGSIELQTYLRMKTPDQARNLNADFDRFIDRHAVHDMGPDAHKMWGERTLPLVAEHLIEPKDAAVIAALGGVGLLTLLLAAVNYVNLATARAGLRAREVAVHKVMGATVPALIGQFMAEALTTAALGALLGLALCELALPLVNAAGGLSLKLDYLGDPSLPAAVLATVVLVGLGAGLYPALILAQYQPAAVLASAKTPGGGRVGAQVREGLVIFQFAVAIAFTIATGVIVSQTSYLRHADIGFNRDGLIIIDSFDDDEVSAAQRANLLDVWRSRPGVVSVTNGDIAPGVDNSTSNSNFKRPGQPGDGPTLGVVKAGPDFFQTYRAHLLAGRFPDREHGADYPTYVPSGRDKDKALETHQPAPNVVLNASAVQTLGFRSPTDAIGKIVREGGSSSAFTPLTVIGVVADIRFRSPRSHVPPTLYFGKSGDVRNGTATVHYSGAAPQAVMDELSADWKRIAPSDPFQAKTIDQNLDHYYAKDDHQGHLFTIGALLAVLIGCVGLYGLASFNTARRVKEIGIRKTLGASTADILKLLVGQFLRPVVIANLFAWPLAWWAMTNYLSGFDQRIALTPVYFLAATALTLLIAVATVAGQAYAVARAEPAKALRHE